MPFLGVFSASESRHGNSGVLAGNNFLWCRETVLAGPEPFD
jgi:hypothetical protein